MAIRTCSPGATTRNRAHGNYQSFSVNSQIFHVIAVTETWLKSEADYSNIVCLNDYVLFRRDHNKIGGGVALFIHSSISATVLCSSDGVWTGKPGKPEYLFCEVTVKGHPPFFIAVVYRPPHAPFLKAVLHLPF